VIDGNQQMAAIGHANQTLTQGARQIDVNYGQARAAAIKYQQDFIAKNGHPDLERLENDAAHSVIEPKDYAGFTGMEFQRPTPQPVLDSWTSQIKNAGSEDEINALRVNIGFAGASKQINGRDVAPLQMMAEQRAKELKTPAGQADIKAKAALEANYYPISREDQRLEARYPGIFARAKQQAMAAYEADTYGKPSDPAKYQEALQKAMRSVPHPGGPPSATKVEPVTPAHEVDDATKAAFKAWLATHPEAAR
jgi:hypothetical protein